MAQVPATPGPQTIVSDAPTGTWRHPRLPEIQARINAGLFGERQVRIVTSNIILLIASVALPAVVSLRWLHFIGICLDAIEPCYTIVLLGSRVFAVANILYACAPLVRKKDDLSDIALTPTQRSLLGLEPTNKPATPGSHYITPPRYSRTPTPRGGSRSGSPRSDTALTSTQSGGYGGSYSPSASPLFQKAIGRDAARRMSQGSPVQSSGRVADQTLSSMFSTPSPSHSRNPSVPFGNRWLYEKSRSSGVSLRSSFS